MAEYTRSLYRAMNAGGMLDDMLRMNVKVFNPY